ncbi:MAG TPA: hypothetical protein DHV36_24965 [Desulfobacteraceae bacterium]|nr:hypothetical protein [Desulfobacteraceae bacterium]
MTSVRFTLLLLLLTTLAGVGTGIADDASALKEIEIKSVQNTTPAPPHNPFNTAHGPQVPPTLPDGWHTADQDDFPGWTPGYLQGWKKIFAPGEAGGIFLGVRRYTAWVSETTHFLRMIAGVLAENGAEQQPFLTSYSNRLDLGIRSGKLIHRDWSLGEISASGPGTGLVIGEGKHHPVHTTTQVFIQPRYTNVYVIYISAPTDHFEQLMNECTPFFTSLKIDPSQIPDDPVVGRWIPDDSQGIALADLLSDNAVSRETGAYAPGQLPLSQSQSDTPLFYDVFPVVESLPQNGDDPADCPWDLQGQKGGQHHEN